jgi:LCP family protein required for cell wall assembly
VKSKPLQLRWSRQEKALLIFVGGASVLLWILLAFSLVSLYGLPSIVHATTTPEAVTPPKATRTPMPPNKLGTPTPSLLPAGENPSSPALAPALTPTPTSPNKLGTPTPSLIPLGNDTVVIALLGIDERRTAGIWRSDSIVLVFARLEAKRTAGAVDYDPPQASDLALLSIPRDLWVYIPGHGYGRINTVDALGERTQYPGGGRGLLDKTLRHNLGVPVDHYVRIDYRGFISIVDALGGVTVNVEKPLTDTFPDPLSPTGSTTISFPAGLRHMDGHEALNYCRSRMTTDDFDRSRRQLQVLQALLRQALTPERLAKAPELWATFSDAFDTDLSMIEAVLLASLVGQSLSPGNVRSAHLDLGTTRPWTTPQGAQVLLPQTEAIQRMILDLLSEP